MNTGRNNLEEETSEHGYQHLVCKNPSCGIRLKTVRFTGNWEKAEHPCSNELKLVHENGSCFYRCPACRSKNFVVFEGEKIILEKITGYEPVPDKPSVSRRITPQAEPKKISFRHKLVFEQ